MVWDQCPCITLSLGFLENERKSLQKRCAVVIVSEDLSSLDTSGPSRIRSAVLAELYRAGITC